MQQSDSKKHLKPPTQKSSKNLVRTKSKMPSKSPSARDLVNE